MGDLDCLHINGSVNTNGRWARFTKSLRSTPDVYHSSGIPPLYAGNIFNVLIIGHRIFRTFMDTSIDLRGVERIIHVSNVVGHGSGGVLVLQYIRHYVQQ